MSVVSSRPYRARAPALGIGDSHWPCSCQHCPRPHFGQDAECHPPSLPHLKDHDAHGKGMVSEAWEFSHLSQVTTAKVTQAGIPGKHSPLLHAGSTPMFVDILVPPPPN